VGTGGYIFTCQTISKYAFPNDLLKRIRMSIFVENIVIFILLNQQNAE